MSAISMISNENLISVIVPVYKVEPYLDRCVESIILQTYTNIEIILVDDGSPDNCPAMCDAWAEKDSRVRVIHKENGGLSDARNAGLALATGEYAAFVDSDDWIAPEMLERLHAAMEQDDSDIAACTVQMVWEDSEYKEFLTVQRNCILEREEAQSALLKESLLKQPVWYKLYRREVVEDIPFEVGKFHEDVYWSYQAIGNARRVSVIDYIGYYYFQRAGSIMGEGYSLRRLDAIEAYEGRYRYLAEHFPRLEVEARIAIVDNCIYHGQMALKYLSGKEQKQVLNYLSEVKDRYPIKHSDYADRKITHRLWLDLGRVSLTAVCRIKNALYVGL